MQDIITQIFKDMETCEYVFWMMQLLNMVQQLLSSSLLEMSSENGSHWPLKYNDEKSRKRETLNLSMCADSSADTKMKFFLQKRKKNIYMSPVTCHMSCVTCFLSPVTCHMSLTQTATATDPPPANSPLFHSKLVCKTKKP